MTPIKTIILCGGIGYRLKEETEFKPKPMVEIGGKPMLWHLMKIYSHWGFNDFLIALGYKGNLIKDYFVNKKYYDGDFTLNTKTNSIRHHNNYTRDNFKITFADTGAESLTGERVRQLKKYIKEKYFMVTYGDGLADLNIKELLKYHISMKSQATITAVYPVLKYGGFDVDAQGFAKRFEKRVHLSQWINGGYMVFNSEILNKIEPNSMIEDIFDKLISRKKLAVYKHKGFFRSMDTYQEMQELNDIWNSNPAWKKWS